MTIYYDNPTLEEMIEAYKKVSERMNCPDSLYVGEEFGWVIRNGDPTATLEPWLRHIGMWGEVYGRRRR